MPDYVATMRRAENEHTRKTLDFAYNTKVMKENIPILKQVLQLRQGTVKKYKSEFLQIINMKI